MVAMLSACSTPSVAKDSDVYAKTLDTYRSGFKILQLTDIHWNFTTDMVKQSAFLTAVVQRANPNLIMITGDSTLQANEEIADRLYNLFDSWNIPYGVSWGNHDRQGTWSPEWISKRATKGKNSLYNEIQDSVTGRSNYVINLRDSSKNLKWQIYSLDSNSYAPNGVSYSYASIDQTQVDWYTAQAEKAKTEAGDYVPSALYFHIPLWEWVYGYRLDKEGVIGQIHEKSTYSVPGLTADDEKIPFWVGKEHSDLFSAAASRGAKAFYCGHDHSNDWGTTYTDEAGDSAFVGYGVKSGRELYYTKTTAGYDQTGGSIMTLRDDGSFTLIHLYVNTDNLGEYHTVSYTQEAN